MHVEFRAVLTRETLGTWCGEMGVEECGQANANAGRVCVCLCV